MTYKVNYKQGNIVFDAKSDNGIEYECFEYSRGYTVYAYKEENIGTFSSAAAARDACERHANSSALPSFKWKPVAENDDLEDDALCVIALVEEDTEGRKSIRYCTLAFYNVLRNEWETYGKDGDFVTPEWEPTHWMYLPTFS